MNRRGFLGSILALSAAPAVVRAGNLMSMTRRSSGLLVPETALLSYGDISPKTAAFLVAQLLKRAQPFLVLESFADGAILPAASSTTVKWRRYDGLHRSF